jgi:hypothetical protein
MREWMDKLWRLEMVKSSVSRDWKQLGKRWNSKWGGGFCWVGVGERGADNTKLQEGGKEMK